jgi:hypothetical protein
MAADDYVTPDGIRIPKSLMSPELAASLTPTDAAVANAVSDDNLKKTFGDENLKQTFGNEQTKPSFDWGNVAQTAKDIAVDSYKPLIPGMGAKMAIDGLGRVAEGAGAAGRATADALGLRMANLDDVKSVLNGGPKREMIVEPPAPGGTPSSPNAMALQAAMGAMPPGEKTTLSASPGVTPQFAGYGGVKKEMDANAKAQQADAQRLGAIQADRAAAVAGEQEGRARAMEQEELRRQAIEQRAQQVQSEQIQKAETLQGELRKLASTKIDPNHFWANKSTGDRMTAAFAVFLGGLGDGPNKAAEIIQNAVDRDIDAQKTNWENARMVKAQEIEGQKNIYGMYVAQLGDARAAEAGARAAALDLFNQRLEATKSKYDSPEIQARAQAAQNVIAGQLADAHKKLLDAVNENAYKKATLEMQSAELQQRREAAQLEAAARLGKATAGKDLPSTEASSLAQLKQGETMLKDLSGNYDKKTGLLSIITKHLPGFDANRYGNDKLAAAQAIGTILEGGKLTDSDLNEKYLPLMPDAGDSEKTKTEKIATLNRILRQTRKAKIEGFAKAGYDVSGFAGDYAELANDDKASTLEAKLQPR